MNGPSSDQRLELLEVRLASAERELAAGRRRGRRATGAALVSICGALLMAFRAPAAGPEPLTVKAPFIVLDAAGRPMVTVDEADDGRGVFVNNRAGKSVAGLFMAHETGQVRVAAQSGSAAGSATMWVTEDGLPRIALEGVGGAQLVDLGVADNKQTQLNVYNHAGETIARVGEQANGAGMLMASSADGSATSTLGVNDAGQAGLRIKAGGRVLAELGAAEKGNMRLKIWGAQGAPVAMMGSSADGSGGAMVVNGGDGKPRGTLSVADGGGQLYVWGAGPSALAQVGVDGGRGTLRVLNKSGGSVVWMDETAQGAGHLAVADPSGAAAAEMGYNGTGIVRALGPGGKIDYLRGPR